MSRPTILIVDDQQHTCSMLMVVIQRLGYGAECALNGPDALSCLKSKAIGLVFLDLIMPGMSGMEVLASIRSGEWSKSVPVVMHSATSDEWTRTNAFVAGAQDFLVKGSYSLDDLERTFGNYIKKESLSG